MFSTRVSRRRALGDRVVRAGVEKALRRSRSRPATTPTHCGRRSKAILRRFDLEFELRTSSDEELCYDVQVPLELPTDRVSNAILRLDPDGHAAVEWAEKKNKKQVKLIIQPDDGITPLVKAVRNAKTQVDILIFRFDRSRAREGARGGGRPRRQRPRPDRAHQPRRREEPAQARAAAARRRRHRWRARPTICRATTAR